MTYFFGFLIDCMHEERKDVLTAVKVLRMRSYPGYSVIPESSACGCQPEDGVFLSSRILNNNRRYFQNTRTFLVNAYFFPGKCLLLSAKMPASFRKKPGSPISEARLSGSKSLRLAFFFSPNIGNGQGLCYKKRMFAFFLHRYSANG